MLAVERSDLAVDVDGDRRKLGPRQLRGAERSVGCQFEIAHDHFDRLIDLLRKGNSRQSQSQCCDSGEIQHRALAHGRQSPSDGQAFLRELISTQISPLLRGDKERATEWPPFLPPFRPEEAVTSPSGYRP